MRTESPAGFERRAHDALGLTRGRSDRARIVLADTIDSGGLASVLFVAVGIHR